IYKDKLQLYGLFGCNSHTKFIPKNYIYNSVDVRKEVLRGLLDTDGSISDQSCIEYSTVSHQLAKDVKEIVQSLGGIAKISSRETYCNGKKFPSYRVRISTNNNIDLFKLDRKKEKGSIRIKGELKRTIRNIEYVGKEECRCIYINHNDHLY